MLVAMIRAYLLSATAGLFAAIVVLLAPLSGAAQVAIVASVSTAVSLGAVRGTGGRWRAQDGPQDAYSFQTDGGVVYPPGGFGRVARSWGRCAGAARHGGDVACRC